MSVMRIFWLFLTLLIGGGLALWWVEARSIPAAAPVEAVRVDNHSLESTDRFVDTAPAPREEAPSPHAASPREPDAADSIQRIDERTLLLAHRFRVTGHGSPTDPYRVQWDLLMSARETMHAEDTIAVVPKWIAPLAGQWIEISGYLSAPTIVDEARDILLTMNRWDGCCVGIPPTPFDCIETRLGEPIKLGGHLIRFGTVRGQLEIEPFLIGGFLVGLYRLDHATITTAQP